MPKIKGPAIFLAQFLRDEEPFNHLDSIGRWVAEMGYRGVQIPTWDARVIDLDRAAGSRTCCDEYRGKLDEIGLEPTELAGQPLRGFRGCYPRLPTWRPSRAQPLPCPGGASEVSRG
jgi:sugar phosphate isomerase/epimerase